MNDIGELLAAIDPNFSSSSKQSYISRRPRDTLEQARAKVVENIDANIALHLGGTPARTPNRLDRDVGNGTSAVGGKYGNTWLKDWILVNGNVQTYVTVRSDKVVETLQLLKQQVLATYADDELEDIMAKNIAIHQAKKRSGGAA